MHDCLNLSPLTSGLLFIFLLHSASMADQENLSDFEMIENVDASATKRSNEGRQTTPTRLNQSIVADQEFVTKISAAI